MGFMVKHFDFPSTSYFPPPTLKFCLFQGLIKRGLGWPRKYYVGRDELLSEPPASIQSWNYKGAHKPQPSFIVLCQGFIAFGVQVKKYGLEGRLFAAPKGENAGGIYLLPSLFFYFRILYGVLFP